MMNFIKLLFETVWELFQTPFPGFEFSIGSVLLGALIAVVSMKLLGVLLGISFGSGEIGVGLGFLRGGVRGGNSKTIHPALPERSGDTK